MKRRDNKDAFRRLGELLPSELVKARFEDKPEKFRIFEDVLKSLAHSSMELGGGDLVQIKCLSWMTRKLLSGEPDLITKFDTFLVEDLSVPMMKKEADAMDFLINMWKQNGEDFAKFLSFCQTDAPEGDSSSAPGIDEQQQVQNTIKQSPHTETKVEENRYENQEKWLKEFLKSDRINGTEEDRNRCWESLRMNSEGMKGERMEWEHFLRLVEILYGERGQEMVKMVEVFPNKALPIVQDKLVQTLVEFDILSEHHR